MTELKIIKMSEIELESVEWLWESYIPYGAISLVQGDGEQGKTMVTLAIAAALSKGDSLPGGDRLTASNVIVQNAEDSYAKTIRKRLEMLGADCDKIHIIDEEEKALSLSDERIEQTIIKTNAKLILIDPVQAYLGGANMNSAGGVRPLMKRLGQVAARHNCAVVLVGHLNKRCGKSQYAGLGSIDIFAAARSVLTVGGSGVDENIRAIVHNKSNLAPAGKSQAFGFDSVSGFTWLGDCDTTIDEVLSGKKKAESQFTRARKLIETALSRGPVLSADMMQMAEEEGISFKTFKRAKEALGVVSFQQGRQWYWQMPIDVEYRECPSEGQSAALVPLNKINE